MPDESRSLRARSFVVRLTADELAAWHAAARAEGYGQTARWVRAVVADAIAGDQAAARDSVLPAEVLGQLGKIGSNVNQLARVANTAELRGEISPLTVEQIEALRGELAELRQALRELPRR